MSAAIVLFGLNLAPLFDAIAKVESDRGATSDNVYQIRKIYVDDVNRIYGLYGDLAYRYEDVRKAHMSKCMMFLYWQYYAQIARENYLLPITYEVLARIHNGGPMGWNKKSTLAYWQKVKRVMEGGKK